MKQGSKNKLKKKKGIKFSRIKFYFTKLNLKFENFQSTIEIDF